MTLETNFETQILQIAALGVWHIVTGRPMTQKLEVVDDPRWNDPHGIFVTLRHHGQVRGSMGMLESSTSLQETLFDAGATAATHDPRHTPLAENELSHIQIEVALLQNLHQIQRHEELELGRQGIVVCRGEAQAVLLPHVAIDHGWNAEQFLEACCEKAGLAHTMWKDPNTLVEAFSCLSLSAPDLVALIAPYVSQKGEA